MCKFCLVASWLGGKKTTVVTKIITPENSAQSSCLNLQLVRWLRQNNGKKALTTFRCQGFFAIVLAVCKTFLPRRLLSV